MTNDSFITGHEQCPACKKKGKDNGHDNLGIYSDGHQYCFSCGYHVHGNRLDQYKRSLDKQIRPDEKEVRLPPDSVPYREAPTSAKKWLEQYELTTNQIINNNVMWSESRHRLIFPYFINGELAAWQGRWFGIEKAPKWYTDGKIDEVLYTRGAVQDTLVLVEDIISAIKVAPHCAASPLFGSVISTKHFRAISHLVSKAIIWLDPDKQKEAVKFANIGRLLGLETHVILSDKDPKDLTNEEISNHLTLP